MVGQEHQVTIHLAVTTVSATAPESEPGVVRRSSRISFKVAAQEVPGSPTIKPADAGFAQWDARVRRKSGFHRRKSRVAPRSLSANIADDDPKGRHGSVGDLEMDTYPGTDLSNFLSNKTPGKRISDKTNLETWMSRILLNLW